MASIPTNRRVHLFLDFDGTITVEDIGDALFQTFGQFEPIHSELLAGRISVAEYYQGSAALLQQCSQDSIQTWAKDQRVDPGFHALMTWANDQRLVIHVVSDGFGNYITPILELQGAIGLNVHCNMLQHTNTGWVPSFPGATESCSCFCASCKRNVVINALGEHDIAIYVGDGRSDTCAASHCDVVFAKRHLAAWCTEQHIPHHPFRTLVDVQRILASKMDNGELRPRRQAVLARQRAVMDE